MTVTKGYRNSEEKVSEFFESLGLDAEYIKKATLVFEAGKTPYAVLECYLDSDGITSRTSLRYELVESSGDQGDQ